MITTRSSFIYKTIVLSAFAIVSVLSLGVRTTYAQTPTCVQEGLLFNSASHNLATDAPTWCGKCPPHAELKNNPNNQCISATAFIADVNTLISDKTHHITLSEMKPTWCDACLANRDTAVTGNDDQGGGGGGGNALDPNDQFSKLKNPLGDSSGVGSLTDFIARILNIVVMVGIPILVLAFMWVGFSYVKAQGNPAKISENHKALLAVIIGGALLIGASKLATAIKDTVEQIGTGGI